MEMKSLAEADPALAAEAQRLAQLSRADFQTEIRRCPDEQLADLRYLLGYRHPGGTEWPVWDINRLLTRRKARREQLPQWIGIAVSFVTSIAALIVSIAK